MDAKVVIRWTAILLLAVVAVVYWKPLLHLCAWLVIGIWLIKQLLRIFLMIAPVIMFILLIWILIH